jgi:hypothetical protein
MEEAGRRKEEGGRRKDRAINNRVRRKKAKREKDTCSSNWPTLSCNNFI